MKNKSINLFNKKVSVKKTIKEGKLTRQLIDKNKKNVIKKTNIDELKQLETTLNLLIEKGKGEIADKYLKGFLEAKNVRTLQEYLEQL